MITLNLDIVNIGINSRELMILSKIILYLLNMICVFGETQMLTT